MITLPGLIDVHVHLRDPGQTEKEDFYTGTSSALAGGFTTVVDMPNNKTPITSLEKLDEKIKIAQEKTVCDIGFYFGSMGDNFQEFNKVKNKVLGIKVYLNVTTGHFMIDEEKLKKIYSNWKNPSPILIHGEDETIDQVLKIMTHPTHFCHVSSKQELQSIIKAKEKGLPVTCGVTPHHLFLTEDDVKHLRGFGIMKPTLKTKKDQEYLWNNLNYVDVIESDHAPHTKEEKMSDKPPFGVPGLETTLPLLLMAEKQGRISRDRILELCFYNPAKLLNLKTDKDTKIEVEDKEYEIKGENLQTKCKWSPFEGWKVRGKVKRVFIRGKKVFEDDKVLVDPGFGRIIST